MKFSFCCFRFVAVVFCVVLIVYGGRGYAKLLSVFFFFFGVGGMHSMFRGSTVDAGSEPM